MAQPCITSFFATRKRPAYDDANVAKAKKVLVLDDVGPVAARRLGRGETARPPRTSADMGFPQRKRLVAKLDFDSVAKKSGQPTRDPAKDPPDIQRVMTNLQDGEKKAPPKLEYAETVRNAMDNVTDGEELSLKEIKSKLQRSSRLAELKASMARFNQSAGKLRKVEEKTKEIVPKVPVLQTFKSIELEVQLSPKKQHTPEKLYLSPKKVDSSPRKNLLGFLSPKKGSPMKASAHQRFQSLSSPGKPTLSLPFTYRSLAEIFRSIDTVASILHNRKETITFAKIQPAVQQMMRRNLTLKHFAQIKSMYPDAFSLRWEKMRVFGTKTDKYELVVCLNVPEGGAMDPHCLLERRRKLFGALVDKLKCYHDEFLQSLDPPMFISKDKLTRWHPEFDIEKVPDVEESGLPEKPNEDRLTTGQEVLEKARRLFNCNTKMERALERLREKETARSTEEQDAASASAPEPPKSVLKGIPRALLEKVRAKQAAKALDAMTRSETQNRDSAMYSRLPDLARLLRSMYVAEKKGVLPLEQVVVKLNNSYRSFLTNSDIEAHLRLLSGAVPGWIVFHEIRGTLFVKVSRDGDMTKVLSKLGELAKSKTGL